jgi:hypothetical protein
MATTTPSRFTRLARWMRSAKGQQFTHTAPALVVFGVAAYQSYWHTVEVVTAAGEGAHGVAHIMALAVDGMMIVAARYMTHAPSRVGKVISAQSFALGVLMTIGMNYLAADPNPLSRLIAVVPAVALIGTAAMLHWGGRKPAKRPAQARTRATGTPATKTALRSVKTA